VAGAAQDTLPLRPLTVGEVLDTATALLRREAAALLPAAAVLAVAEQAVLYPLRLAAGAVPPSYLPPGGPSWVFWLLIGAGLGTETVIVTGLGGLAGRAAVPVLLDRPRSSRGGTRAGPLALLALVLGVVAGLAAVAGLLPWLAWYLFTGLAGPALLVERVAVPAAGGGPGLARVPVSPLAALGRSFALVGRAGLRPGGIRLLGVLAWMAIRLALGLAAAALLLAVLPAGSRTAQGLLTVAAFTLVNTIAYATLGCLDVVLLVETRVRVEGLDIAVARARSRGLPVDPTLVVPGRVARRSPAAANQELP